MTQPFTLLRPSTVKEAGEMLLHHGDEARPIAGGTALQIFRQLGLLKLTYLVDLAGIPGLRGITSDQEWLTIGAMTPLFEVERVPLLAQTYSRIANPRVRTTATVGGNLAHGDYRIDPPAMLLPLAAEVVTSARTLPIDGFFVGLEETALQPGEILTAVRVPLVGLPDRAYFWKFSSLAANDWPCFGAGVCLWLDEDGRCVRARAGVTAMAPTPLLVDLPLAGRGIDEAVARDAGDYVASIVDPIPDQCGSVAYKRNIAAVCTADAVMAARG